MEEEEEEEKHSPTILLFLYFILLPFFYEAFCDILHSLARITNLLSALSPTHFPCPKVRLQKRDTLSTFNVCPAGNRTGSAWTPVLPTQPSIHHDSFPFCQFPKRLEMAAAAARGKVGWDQYRTSSEAAAAAGCHYAPIEEKLRDQKKNFLNSNGVRAQLEALKKYSLVIVKKKDTKKV
jgi:hypothetical protein